MPRRALPRSGWGRTLFLAALLLVPLTLGAHHHGVQAASGAGCTVCLAAHQSPALRAPAPVAPAPVLATVLIVPVSFAAPAHGAAPRPSGRAPPVSSPVQAV